MPQHIASGHIGGDAGQPSLEALWMVQLVHLGKGQKKRIVCQLLCNLMIAHNALAYHRHLPMICPIQVTKSGLVALSPSLYQHFYVHSMRTVSIHIDAISSIILHGNCVF